MTKPQASAFSYHDVIEACAGPGCPLCRLSNEAVDGYLDAILYESVNDPAVRDRLRQSLAYCNTHAWRLPGHGGAALGIAIVYRDMLAHVANNLGGARYQPGGLLQRAGEALGSARPATATEAVVRELAPRAECPACEHRDRMEEIVLTTTLDAVHQGDESMQTALLASASMCLPHLRRALSRVRSQAAFEFLQRLGAQSMGALLAELDEFIRKNDYRFRGEGFGAEGDSWRRAIAMLAGAEGTT
jgi:hypothetical protein